MQSAGNSPLAGAVYRGIVKGHTIVMDGKVSLPEGTEVQVIPTPPEPGSAAAILAAMKAPPHLTEEDVDELERAIEAGRRPLSHVQSLAAGPAEGPD